MVNSSENLDKAASLPALPLITPLITKKALAPLNVKILIHHYTIKHFQLFTEIAWHKFDWKYYIQKDVKSEDYTNPTDRFGIHLLNSIKIGVNRTVPDNRNPICAKTDWDEKTKGNAYPDVSVIITYRDEPRSTLLRTVVSVLERSSKELIKEIILVDDNNDDITIGQELKIIKKVKVIRNENREGLIRSRIKATNAAKGEVLVFLGGLHIF